MFTETLVGGGRGAARYSLYYHLTMYNQAYEHGCMYNIASYINIMTYLL